MQIDGKEYTGSPMAALAKHRASQHMEHEKEHGEKEPEMKGEHEPELVPHEEAAKYLASAHGEHAEKAAKSAHVYAHKDGTHHVHLHDHEAGTHEHQKHDNGADAMAAAHQHLGVENAQVEGGGGVPKEASALESMGFSSGE